MSSTTQQQLPAGSVIVTATRLIGTSMVTYAVYVACTSMLASGFGTIQCMDAHDGQWFGRMGTDRLPASLDALPPRTRQRSDAVTAWQQERYADAYALIIDTYPAAEHGQRSMGEITVTVEG